MNRMIASLVMFVLANPGYGGGEALVAHYGDGKSITVDDVRDWFAVLGMTFEESDPESIEFAARQIGMGAIACKALRDEYPDDYQSILDLAPWVRRHYAVHELREVLLQESRPGEDEIQSAYQRLVDEFQPVTELTFDHLFLDTHNESDSVKIQAMEENANQLHARMMAGESFTDLARQFSMAKSALEGGRSGPVPLGRLSKAIEDRILALQDGEIGPVYKSPFGFHIFRRISVIDSMPPSYEEKKESLAEQLAQQGAKEREESLTQEIVWKVFSERLYSTLPWSLATAHLPGLATEEVEVFLRNELALENEVQLRGLNTNSRVIKQLALWEGRECLKAYLNRISIQSDVSMEEVEKYIQNYPERLQSPKQYELKLIKINDRIPEQASPAQVHLAQEATQKRIEEARRELLNGASFADVAREYSDDPSAVHGGDIGIAPADRFGHAIAEARHGLTDGEISDVVRGGNYSIIVQQVATFVPQPLAPEVMRSEAKKQIQSSLRREALQREQKSLLERIGFQMVTPQDRGGLVR